MCARFAATRQRLPAAERGGNTLNHNLNNGTCKTVEARFWLWVWGTQSLKPCKSIPPRSEETEMDSFGALKVEVDVDEAHQFAFAVKLVMTVLQVGHDCLTSRS